MENLCSYEFTVAKSHKPLVCLKKKKTNGRLSLMSDSIQVCSLSLLGENAVKLLVFSLVLELIQRLLSAKLISMSPVEILVNITEWRRQTEPAIHVTSQTCNPLAIDNLCLGKKLRESSDVFFPSSLRIPYQDQVELKRAKETGGERVAVGRNEKEKRLAS